jgi:hypothetical protein
VIDQPRFEVSLELRRVHRSIFPATPAGVRAVATGAEILVKASVAETSKAPVAETGEDHPVVMDLENLQRLGNGGAGAVASAAGSISGSFQRRSGLRRTF